MDTVKVEAGSTPVKKRQIGLLDGVVFVLSCTIGSGLFFTPRQAGRAVADPWVALIAWLIAGVLSLAGSLIYSELGTSLVSAGAESYYLLKAFGSAMSFTFSWTMVTIIGPSSCACISWVLGTYFNAVIGAEHNVTVFIVAVSVMCGLCAINLVNPNYVLMLNRFNVVCKILAVTVVVITGLVAITSGIQPEPFLLSPLSSIGSASWTQLGNAVMFALFAMSGWNMLNPLIEEIRNPGKDVPKIYSVGMIGTMIFAVLVNAAFYAGLSRADIITSPDKQSLAKLLASACVADGPWRSAFRVVLCVLICFCCLGSCNGIMMGTSKCMASNGRDGILPRTFGVTSRKHGVPFVALISFTSWTIMLLGVLATDPDNALDFVINLYTVGQWGFFAIVGVSLFVLRYKYPDLNRPYKIHLYPVFPAVFVLAAVFIVVMTFAGKQWVAAVVSVSIVALGASLYFASEVEVCRRMYAKVAALVPDFEQNSPDDTVQLGKKARSTPVEG